VLRCGQMSFFNLNYDKCALSIGGVL
jgi:hypothetical protein